MAVVTHGGARSEVKAERDNTERANTERSLTGRELWLIGLKRTSLVRDRMELQTDFNKSVNKAVLLRALLAQEMANGWTLMNSLMDADTAIAACDQFLTGESDSDSGW